MAKAKTSKRVVVKQVYLDLLRRKADLLDEVFEDGAMGARVTPTALKTYGAIEQAWGKADNTGDDTFLEEVSPYEEPKPAAPLVAQKAGKK